MKTQKLTLNQLMQDAEVIEKENLNTIKGGITARELLDEIAMNGVDAYVGKYEFGDGGGSDATRFSFDQSTIAFINAEVGIGGGGGGGYTTGFSAYGGQGSYNNPIQLNEVNIEGYRKICPECLNPSTTNQNIFGLTYPGGENPKSYNGEYNYSYIPNSLAEYPAIGHDRRYDNLRTSGLSGLLTDTKAIGADWRFVSEELSIAINPFLDFSDRAQALLLSVGLSALAMPKTVYQMSIPNGYEQIDMWYNISNVNVNNRPTIHQHE